MTNVQEWWEKKHPSAQRSQYGEAAESSDARTIYLVEPSQEGELDLRKQNLEGSLDLSDFSSLKELDCSGNQLTNLNLSNCLQLEESSCSNNGFSSDLAWLTPLLNLKKLNLENNNFQGSLAPLEN